MDLNVSNKTKKKLNQLIECPEFIKWELSQGNKVILHLKE